MARLIALVVAEQQFEDRWLQEMAEQMGYGARLDVERRVQSPDVFLGTTPFRTLLESLLAEAEVQSVAFVFPPALRDRYNLSQVTSGVSFTWNVVESEAVAGVSSMSSLHEGLIIYGRAAPKAT